MKFRALMILLLMFCCSVALSFADSAEAARLGGGRSFGGKPPMSAPAPAMRQQTPGAQNPAMNQAQQTRPQTAAAAPSRPGLFGGMGGLFGGLLAGTLIGSLLAGTGFAGGGFMDILLFGLLIFLGLKLFARFRSRPAEAVGGQGAMAAPGGMDARQGMRRDDMGGNGWGGLRSTPQGQAAEADAEPRIPMPDGFDAEEFLRGAKMAYARLQNSWDKRDLNDIAQFTTTAVQEAVSEQMAADPGPSTTEVLLVNAQLLGVENEGDEQRAQVFFDVLLREDPRQEAPSTVREVWHFMRPLSGGSWKLDGIQQVE